MRSWFSPARWVLVPAVLLSLPTLSALSDEPPSFPVPQIPWEPQGYVCMYTPKAPQIDGRLDDACWQAAAWTESFVDIEGHLKPLPFFDTRAKMLWDDTYFYVSALLEQPHLWGTLTERDAVIFHNDDFEVFIDPDGDTHEYYELEINELGTVWDLLLGKPYRDGAPAVDSWDIQGLQSAVELRGTINDAGDEDEGWSLELAFPWSVLEECAHRSVPPEEGDQWRINFSRVEWLKTVTSRGYEKKIDPETERPSPEYNWVWSPQGLIAMHYPEMWGVVQFSRHAVGTDRPEFRLLAVEKEAHLLWEIYYKQKGFEGMHGRYATDISELTPFPPEIPNWGLLKERIRLVSTGETYELSFPGAGGVTHFVSEDGHGWRRKEEEPTR